MSLALVGLGGALGSMARYLVGGWVLALAGPGFPFGTILINTLGSFLIVVITQLSVTTSWISPDARLFLTTGVLGGFTTYSTFNYESIRFFQQGNWSAGLLNFAVTLVLCAVAGGAGLLLARVLAPGA